MISRVWDGLLTVLGIVVFTFKKEILDWLKNSFKAFVSWLKGWRQNRHFARQVTDMELKTILENGVEGIETPLYFLMEEYLADRATITEYVENDTGGALVTCLVEAHSKRLKSVRNLQKSLLEPPGLWREIQHIEHLENRVLYVKDARLSDSAALRVALVKGGVWSAYYQIISEPGSKPLRLFALSWGSQHDLSREQLNVLYFSGIFCSSALLNLDKWKAT
jgi:hypothetical protein